MVAADNGVAAENGSPTSAPPHAAALVWLTRYSYQLQLQLRPRHGQRRECRMLEPRPTVACAGTRTGCRPEQALQLVCGGAAWAVAFQE